MGRLLEHLEKLNYFKIVSEASSFHRASKVLGISQSGLSHSVKSLEEVMGVMLFHRSVKGVRLTPHGKELLTFTNKLVKEVDRFDSGFGETAKKTFSIGTYDTISVYLLPDIIKKLSKKNVSVNLEIEKSNKKLIELTIDGEIDISFMAEAPVHKEIASKKILQESYDFFVSSNVLKKKKAEISIFDELPLLYFPEAIAGRNLVLDKALNRDRAKIANRISLNSFESIKSMTSEGLGIGLMPNRVGLKAIKTGSLKKIEIHGLPKNFGKHFIYAYWRKENSDFLAPLLNEF